MLRRWTARLTLFLLLCACGADSEADPAAPEPGQPTSQVDAEPTEAKAEPSEPAEPAFDQTLHDELIAMRDDDQASRTGGPFPDETDEDRAARLAEIIDEYGWPTPDLVGQKGVSAAWLIAQHADFDVAFQQQVRDLMGTAVRAGDADPTELAFLDDRIAVNLGVPQAYGSQIRCVRGTARPATPIKDAADVEQRREDVGLEPLSDYLAELDAICASEQ